MPNPVTDRVFRFACDFASASRLFTLAQLARHPDLSWRSQPTRRAGEILRKHKEYFEKSPGPMNKPFTWRLSKYGRRKLGVTWNRVSGMSQKQEHWLGLGDIWLELTFHGGRPERWTTEHYQVFDVYFIWQRVPYLLEYQRTPITTKQWEKKWKHRLEWYKEQRWEERPKVVLVNTTGQQDDTICLPRGTVHVREIERLHNILRPPQK